MVGTETKKGVSPVIASVLMVVIAIVLVGFAYTMFSGFARKGGEVGEKAMGEMEKSYQKLRIETAFYRTADDYLCFKIKAPLSNSMTVPIKNYVTYFADGVEYTPTENLTVCGFSGNACNTTVGLNPGDACYDSIKVANDPSFFEIKHEWGLYDGIVPAYK